MASESVLCLEAFALRCLSSGSLQALTIYGHLMAQALPSQSSLPGGKIRVLVHRIPHAAGRQGFPPQINRAMLRMRWTLEAEFYL